MPVFMSKFFNKKPWKFLEICKLYEYLYAKLYKQNIKVAESKIINIRKIKYYKLMLIKFCYLQKILLLIDYLRY